MSRVGALRAGLEVSEPWEKLPMFPAEPCNSLNFSNPNLSMIWHEVRKAGSAESEKVSNPAQGDSLPSFITAMNERLFQASHQSLSWLCFPALIPCD